MWRGLYVDTEIRQHSGKGGGEDGASLRPVMLKQERMTHQHAQSAAKQVQREKTHTHRR